MTFTTKTLNSIPSNWVKKAVLARPCGMNQPERFGFFQTPNGQVAQVFYHPMNGPDQLFCRISDSVTMAAEYKELLEGERYEQRTDIGYGRMDVRRGRRVKATRIG